MSVRNTRNVELVASVEEKSSFLPFALLRPCSSGTTTVNSVKSPNFEGQV